MVGLNGERDLSERLLKDLSGYRASSPVRIGNGAWEQFQLDVYGIILDAMYFSHRHGRRISIKVYKNFIRHIVEGVEKNWKKPDCGIWEVRGEMKHFVYSKMWCWVAIDRAVKIADSIGMKEDSDQWSELRAQIRSEIYEKGWDEKLQSFVRSYGSTDLDSANLLMPQVRFIDPNDPKIVATIERTKAELMTQGKFLYRYRTDDGLPGGEGAFLMCSFWFVTTLAMAGKTQESVELLDSLVKFSNHVGLFSEEIDPLSGELLGNFPQAFTHMGFINAAATIEKARKKL
jgi:GH15 family glucan-1,4-alpha-glucosidase